ncbi:MAG: glycosyltransferase family 39 protein [Elusimicrobia bacterium]|nr:glycosyltransferase family 39 protein [Elusimicrobiota bacterium]
MTRQEALVLLAGVPAVLAAFCGELAGLVELGVLAALLAALVAAARWSGPRVARWPRRRFLIGLASLAAGLRLAWVAAVPNGQVSDFAIYHELAAALASGKGYAITGPVGKEDLVAYLGDGGKPLPYATSYRPPGTAFLGALLYLPLGPHPLWMKLLNVLLGASTVLLLYLGLARSATEPAARLAALAWAVYPSAVFATNLFCSEVPFTAALAGLAWLASVAGGSDRRRPWVALGLLAAAACLLRPMWLPLSAALAVVCFLRPRLKVAAPKYLVFLAALGLGLLPWAWRNTRLWGRPTGICTDGGMVLAYHTARLLPESAANDPALRERVARWRAMKNESEQSGEGYALAALNLKAVFGAGPLHVGRSLLRCLDDMFGDDEEMLHWSTLSSRYARVLSRRAVYGLGRLDAAFYAGSWLLALLGLWRRGAWASLPDGGRFLLLNFLATFVLFLFIPGQARYHFSLMPAVFLLAAVGITAVRRP